MHEYALVADLVRMAQAQASSYHASAIHRLEVRVGELSGVEPELLAAAYDIFRPNTVCEQAELEIHLVPASWRCPLCGREITRGEPLQCPKCLEPARLTSGDEILLERIELEVD